MKQEKTEDVSVGSGAVATPSFPIGMKRKDVDGKKPTPSSDVYTRNKFKIFEISNKTFVKFKAGQTSFEEWCSYLNMNDPSDKNIYEYAKTHKNTKIILKNDLNGALKSITRGKNE
jgi:hypothetical protein